MKYALIRISDAADWQVYHAIRRSSLWEESGFSGYDDARPQERFPHHHALLLKLDEKRIGTTGLDDLQDGTGIVRLVAIAASFRRQGYGRVLDAMVEKLRTRDWAWRPDRECGFGCRGVLYRDGMDPRHNAGPRTARTRR